MTSAETASGLVRVVVTGGQPLIRTAVAALLHQGSGLAAWAAAHDELHAAVRDHQPDIVLVIGAETPRAVTVAADLTTTLPDCRIAMLTSPRALGAIRRALSSGVQGLLPTTAPAPLLLDMLRTVAQGTPWVAPDLAAPALAASVNPLSGREQQVLLAAADGTRVELVAARMGIARGTVRNYLSACIQKLGVTNRGEAVETALANGWLDADPSLAAHVSTHSDQLSNPDRADSLPPIMRSREQI